MADFYIANTSIGTGDASSSSNAAGVSYFNTSSNWANPKVGGKIGPGDTIHLIGTINPQGSGAIVTATISGGAVTGFTGLIGGSGYLNGTTVEIFGGGGAGATATVTISGGIITAVNLTSGGSGYISVPTVIIIGVGLTVENSGSSGSPITILFNAGASLQAPVWASASGAINVGSRSYIVIDGGSTGLIGSINGNPQFTNGFITNTANGTVLANQASSIFIYGPDSTNITVQNLLLYNLYVRTSTLDSAPAGGSARSWSAITAFYNGNTAPTNWKVTNCLIHDAYSGFFITYYTGSTNFEYSFCTVYNCNWGGNSGDYGIGATTTILLVHDNYFHDWANWDDTSGANAFHHNGFFGWAVSGGTSMGLRYYNNVVGPNFGGNASSGMFVQGWITDVIFYNNIFLENVNDHPQDGLIYVNPYPDITGSYSAYNNTMIGQGSGIGTYFGPDNIASHTGTAPSGQTYNIYNNLMFNTATAVELFYTSATTININYNCVYGLNPNLQFSYSSGVSSSFKTFAQWQSLGFDTNGRSGNPNLSPNYKLTPGSLAIGSGTNLSSIFGNDILGNVRATISQWDIGAYMFLPVVPSISFPQSIKL